MTKKNILYLSGFTLLVVLIDILIRPSLNLNITFDFIVLSICGIIGLKFVTILGLPIFILEKENPKQIRLCFLYHF